MSNRSEEETAECPTCGMPFLTDDSVIRHYIRNHQGTNSRRPYRCGECEDWVIRAPYEVGKNTFCSSDCNWAFRGRDRSGENGLDGSTATRGQRWQLIALHVRCRDDGCRVCGRPRSQSGRQLHVHHIVPEAEVPDDLDPHTPANLVPLCASCHKRVEGWSVVRQLGAYDVDSLREFAFDDSQRAMVNDLMSKTLGARYDHLSEQQRAAFIDRFDPVDPPPAAVTDW